MRKLTVAAAILAALGARPAAAAVDGGAPSYVAVATFTPSATGSNSWSFFNRGGAKEIRVQRIDMGSCTSAAATANRMQFWIKLASNVVDGGAAQVSSYTLSGLAWPASVTMSTGPGSPAYEAAGADTPLFLPCIVDPGDTASASLSQNCYDASASPRMQPIILKAGQNRGVVAVKKQLGATDYTAGCVSARVEFTAE